MLFPLVDRDGLCKPLLQIIAEDALGSGIERVAVVANPAARVQLEAMLESWQGPAGLPQDWVRLEKEKLETVASAIEFIDAPQGEGSLFSECLNFIRAEPFAFLPADALYVSGTKDRCLQQLVNAAAGLDFQAVLAVCPIMAREAYAATVVRASGNEQLSPVSKMVEKPSLEQCGMLYTPGLPPGQYLAATGMCLLSPGIFSVKVGQLSLFQAVNELQHHDQTFAATLAAARFDLRTAYGFLEAQLALGLAGIHRADICELIARTLTEQAKN